MEKLYRKNKEMHKVSKGIATEHGSPLWHLVFNSTKTASLGSKIWDLVPHEIKQKEPMAAFVNSTMAWNPLNSPLQIVQKMLPALDLFELRFSRPNKL